MIIGTPVAGFLKALTVYKTMKRYENTTAGWVAQRAGKAAASALVGWKRNAGLRSLTITGRLQIHSIPWRFPIEQCNACFQAFSRVAGQGLVLVFANEFSGLRSSGLGMPTGISRLGV